MRKIISFIILVAVAFGVYKVYDVYNEMSQTVSTKQQSVVVEIPKGASERRIAEILKENGVIKNEISFLLKMRYSEYRGMLSYGVFTLDTGMCIDDIVQTVMQNAPQEESIKVTIPEGFSAEMIAKRCEEKGLVKAEDFLDELENGKFQQRFIKEIPKREEVKYYLQGYLFPSTYMFKKSATAHDIINTMLSQFEKKYNSVKNENKTAMSMNEIVTAASLIEREARLADERTVISGVIQNRIKKGMRLQIDASVVYVISDGLYDVNRVLYKDLESDSPYNTYKMKGLPIGAICNPGIESIKAAMNPMKHTYLYYHTDTDKNDGSHIFSETYSQHLSNQ